jgi:hypothetical protein
MRNPLILCLAIVSLAFLPAGSCGNPGPKPVPTEVDAGPEPDPEPTPDPEPGPAPVNDTCGGYCSHLSDLRCSEGTHPKCKALCEKVLEENLIRLPINCVMRAPTKAAAITCGAQCK